MTEPAADPILISIADDHQMFVEAMCLILGISDDIDVVSVARNGDALIEDVRAHQPDIALVDISMDGPGFEAIASAIARVSDTTHLIAVTMHLDRDLAERAIASGYSAYVVKDAAVAELLTAIRTAMRDETFMSRAISELPRTDGQTLPHLTPREAACLRGASKGLGNREIASELGISERTVKFHFENVFRKLSVRSRGEAVAMVLQRKLV